MKHTKIMSLAIILSSIVCIFSQTIDFRVTKVNNWACSLGYLQSPTQLLAGNSIYNPVVGLVTDSYQTFTNGVVYVNQSRGLVEFRPTADILSNKYNTHGSVILNYQEYYVKFDLVNVVIKSPTEHTIEGKTYELEVQLIHQRDLTYKTPENNFKTKTTINDQLIISIPFSPSVLNSPAGFLDIIASTFQTSNIINSSTIGRNTDLSQYNLINDKSFYLYAGSETQNPCNENVIHLVFREPMYVTQATFAFFKSSIFGAYFTSGINTKTSIPNDPNVTGRVTYRNFLISQTEQGIIKEDVNSAINTLENTYASTAAKNLDNTNNSVVSTNVAVGSTQAANAQGTNQNTINQLNANAVANGA